MNFKTILLLVATCAGIASCNQDQKKMPATAASVLPAKPKLEEPFKYHKMIEVAPGQYYDVLSWGRGTKGGGAYMVLRSDSAEQQYDSTTGDLEGPVQDVLNADLDVDGNPEIIIQAKSIDTSRFTNVFVYEYNGKRSQKIEFPRMTASQRKGFRGNDNLYIKNSKLMRQFPVYEGGGAGAKPTGQKRLLEYSLHSNSFSVRTVSTDTTAKAKNVADKLAEKERVQSKPAAASKEGSRSGSSKKHTVKKRKTHKTEARKRRRHRD